MKWGFYLKGCFKEFLICLISHVIDFSDAAMATASRHFRVSWWFNAILFSSVNMVLNNVRCIRKFYHIDDSGQHIREQVSLGLLKKLTAKQLKNDPKKSKRPYIPLYLRNKKELHKLRLDGLNDHLPDTRKYSSVRCVLCKKKVTTICAKCNVHVHLGKCFQEWHNSVKI